MPSKRSNLLPFLMGWVAKLTKCRNDNLNGDISVQYLYELFCKEIDEDLSMLSFVRLMSNYMQTSNLIKSKTKRLYKQKNWKGIIILIHP